MAPLFKKEEIPLGDPLERIAKALEQIYQELSFLNFNVVELRH